MIYVIVSTAIVGWLAVMLWLLSMALEDDKKIMGFSLLAVWLVISLSASMWMATKEEDKGPCLHYETQMYWNAATKTMMPARVCTARAEWIEK